MGILNITQSALRQLSSIHKIQKKPYIFLGIKSGGCNGFDYHLENHLRETYKYLIKMDDLHEVQKAMMRFVRSLGDIYTHELKVAFIKLHKELKQYEEDPYERRAFLYLDILSWLESKIENRSIGEIIREKAKVINRKERNSIRV